MKRKWSWFVTSNWEGVRWTEWIFMFWVPFAINLTQAVRFYLGSNSCSQQCSVGNPQFFQFFQFFLLWPFVIYTFSILFSINIYIIKYIISCCRNINEKWHNEIDIESISIWCRFDIDLISIPLSFLTEYVIIWFT